jgi:hypothetical protein
MQAGLVAYLMALPALTAQLLVPGSTAQRVKNYIVTGSPLLQPPAPPGGQSLAWQRVTPFLSFPEQTGPGTTSPYTLGYPFPASVPWIYNGAWEA